VGTDEIIDEIEAIADHLAADAFENWDACVIRLRELAWRLNRPVKSVRERYAKEIAAGEVEVTEDGGVVTVALLKPISLEDALRSQRDFQKSEPN
jgi:hypothetical protein